MAKLIMISLAFTAFIALGCCSHRGTIISQLQQQSCSQEIEEQELNWCESYLQDAHEKEVEVKLEECCLALEYIDLSCQCEAVKKVFQDIKTKLQQEEVDDYNKQIAMLKQKALVLPILCNTDFGQPCEVETPASARTSGR